MDIRDSAYQFCTSAIGSRYRDDIQKVINSLTRATPAVLNTLQDRSLFGYAAHKLYSQFLGFIMVDLRREQLIKSSFPQNLPTLKDDERRLLWSVHRNIVELNRKCVARLALKSAILVDLVNPYNRLRYESEPTYPEIAIWNSEIVDSMAASFSNHPAISVAVTETAWNQAKVSGYTEAVWKLTDSLQGCGVLATPEDISRLFRLGKADPQRITARHFVALTCIRQSLSVLNQLIYQTIMDDKLPVLNQDNIIKIHGPVSHLVGQGLSITTQPTDRSIASSINDLILVDCAPLMKLTKQLCRIEKLHFEDSKDFGATIEFGLREIDENLNPFGTLLSQL